MSRQLLRIAQTTRFALRSQEFAYAQQAPSLSMGIASSTVRLCIFCNGLNTTRLTPYACISMQRLNFALSSLYESDVLFIAVSMCTYCI